MQRERPISDISAPSKRRKTYTIRKQREAWTEEEHQKFLEALGKFGRDWKNIEAYVGTKTLIQIRSHAQKHFEKLERKGNSSAIPPPKPKRRQEKVSVDGDPLSDPLMIPWITTPDALSEKPYLGTPEPFAEWMKSNGFLPDHPPPGIDTEHLAELQKQQREYLQQSMKSIQNALFLEPDRNEQGHPDWAKIYSYFCSLFESDTLGHNSSRMASMGPAERQIMNLLMQNLLTNLDDDSFSDNYRILLRQYENKQQDLKRAQRDSTTPLD